MPPWHFDAETATRLLSAQFGTQDLQGFGVADLTDGIRAAGALLQYVRDTQKSALPHVRSIVAERHSDALQVDAASRRNLELESSLSGNADASLAAVLDHCATTMGSRLLRRWLNRPLRDQALLRQRYQALDSLRDAGDDPLRDLLADIGDLERILSRIALGSARPRDLAQLRTATGLVPEIDAQLAALDSPLLATLRTRLGDHAATHALLKRAIIEQPPQLIRDGGVLAAGYDADTRRAPRHQRERRPLPHRPGGAGAGADGPAVAEGRLQPGPRLLHRAVPRARRPRRRTTTSAARR